MRPVEVVCKVAPHARSEYVTAFENGDAQFAAAGVTTPLRLAHFLAQILEETGGLVITTESGNYSAQRIREVWPSRPSAVAYAHQPEALFNHVYANRMGNGPPESGDGWKYRGRGILQTTGREAYRKYGKRCGVDFEGNPDLVFDPRYALMPALAEWTDSGCNALADRDDIRAITLRVNGGLTNFSERVRWLHVVKPAIGDKVDLTEGAHAAPLPKPTPKPLPSPVAPGAKPAPADHLGLGAAILGALAAAWKAINAGRPGLVVVAIVIVGVILAARFLRAGK